MNWQTLIDLFDKGMDLSILDIAVALVFALVSSIVVLLMYNYFYGSGNVGSGVQRSFLLLGPSITALFLGIQFSLPLSLGLLGSLSIIRFRTPVKDSAEIGFLMLLIGAAIGSATFNYLLVGMLFIVAFISLVLWHTIQRGFGSGQISLIITLNNPEDIKLESKLTSFTSGRLRAARLESISTMDDTTSLHYKFNKRARFDWGTFTEELNQQVAPTKVKIFIG